MQNTLIMRCQNILIMCDFPMECSICWYLGHTLLHKTCMHKIRKNVRFLIMSDVDFGQVYQFSTIWATFAYKCINIKDGRWEWSVVVYCNIFVNFTLNVEVSFEINVKIYIYQNIYVADDWHIFVNFWTYHSARDVVYFDFFFLFFLIGT